MEDNIEEQLGTIAWYQEGHLQRLEGYIWVALMVALIVFIIL